MFSTFFRFELRYWLRSMMLYVFIFVIGLLVFLACSSDNVQVGVSVDNTKSNAPYVIQMLFGAMGIMTTVMVAAFLNTAATRDFTSNMHQIMFTKPIRKLPFLLGRFTAATLIATVPLLGVSIGSILAAYAPWVEAENYGPVVWQAHVASFFLHVVPNTILIAAIIFAIAVWSRSAIAAFLGAILIIVASAISSTLVGNLDNDTLAALSDPFGMDPFGHVVRYWTPAEKENQFVGLTGVYQVIDGNVHRVVAPSLSLDYLWKSPHGLLLLNRLIWVIVGMGIFGAAAARFRFADRNRKSKKVQASEAISSTTVPIPIVSYAHSRGSQWTRLASQIKVDFWGIIKSNVFIVLMFVALLNTVVALIMSSSEGFGLRALPVTYNVVSIIRGTMYIFLLATIVFFAGVLVWKERDAKLDEVFDALPQPTWVVYLSKLMALTLVVACVIGVGMLSGIAVQASRGYTRFQIPVYLSELFQIDMVTMFAFCVLALISHVLAPNKYAGYFLFLGLAIVNFFAGQYFQFQTRMLRYGSLPNYTYSDLYKYAPFSESLNWFSAYWLAVTGMLSVAAILLWQRGKESSLFRRIAASPARLKGGLAGIASLLLIGFTALTGWTYFNTQVLNDYDSTKVARKLRADYEKELKEKYEGITQPRITKVKYDIAVFPSRRGLHMAGDQVIENKSDETIEQLIINMPDDDYETEIEIEGTRLAEEIDRFDFRVYDLDPPMEPGETRQMTYSMKYEPVGFENSVSNRSVVQNGTFFNNGIVPQIGYQPDAELSDKKQRKKQGLAPKSLMPPLEPDNIQARMNTYISNNSDWVDVETTISTSADQIAIAPGSLQKSWEEDGRRYFHYKVDHPSLNFYSFISARYKVAVRQWKGVDIEVYYHPEHEWNVENMLRSIQKSLEYYTEEFGPYKHKQARIIEFPRVARFAQAFPGTMPYSEGIGFIADIEKEDDIDKVYYVVAHEMAHQWWAHQICGANMQGATVLSETMAQYSALMVMEREYGRDMMRKFLQYEMDRYLNARGGETMKERPLAKVESQQGYIHYQKGSLVMYYLKEMIGEEKINTALKGLIDKFAYQGPPYPTSKDLVDALREQTPEDYQYLLTELFDEITLFANRTKLATAVEREDGKYDITIEVECQKFKADEEGAQTEVTVDDYIEIGAFAKPEKDKRYGKTLYRERKKITEKENSFTFTVDELPEKAGIDPFTLLIDRMPDDNMKKVKIVTEP